ncbi:MAG TPA: 2OG-Fe(II) oxygenase family protein [Reyranella sp.]|jgi:isopenicillin N synthase-like dioxygenase|nr:2OG-Fe(II) oxygenase family protein [Reyranella sp.]
MQSLAPSLPPVRTDAPEEIPVLDLAPYLAGEAGALQRLGAQLRRAFEEIGFYFIVGHGVPQSLVDAAFAEAARFHAQPLEGKLAVRMDETLVGYLPVRGSTTRHSQINPDNKPNVNEAFFSRRTVNKWPANLPGFRETVIAYQAAMEKLAKSLLPLYATALDLPAGHFDALFAEPSYTLRMSHYPQHDAPADNEFGLAPHTDTSFMTLLAQNKIPGLSIRLPTGRWVDAPAIDGAFLVNGGDLLRRWTNDRFLATPHRVANRSGKERYAIPFFFDCGAEVTMECLPTCRESGQPARYEPITYAAYMDWYRRMNFGQAKDRLGVSLSAY